jgi:formylglycine-generating enzyme required for sulfatase activity
MKYRSWMMAGAVTVVAMVLLAAGAAMADTFGTGVNQFTLDFVPISGATNPTNTSPSGGYGIVNHDYSMGIYEITNDQWNKFTASLGVPVTGSDGSYSSSSHFTGTNVPTDSVSWYEAAQFVNWLNTSTGNQAAYKFTGTQGQSNYAFAAWSPTDTGHYDAGDPYRNKAAKYFLPTEDEWVKAAYWNSTTTTLQDYATKAGTLFQGNGTSGTGWNYSDNGYATNPPGPWNVGSGSQELNGTYDMMGNDWEWMESPWSSGDYGASSWRGLRGFGWADFASDLAASSRDNGTPTEEYEYTGFRVASVPEPGSIVLLGVGAISLLAYVWRRRRKLHPCILLVLGIVLATSAAQATDVFNMGGTRNPMTGTWTGLASLEFVTVGNPGNAPSAYLDVNNNPAGSVGYTYQMGMYDVTAAQYCQFLNAVAGGNDTYGLYSGQCNRTGSVGSWHYNITGDGNFPVTNVTWGDTVRFCNWLTNGQPTTGVEDLTTTENGSYYLNGAVSNYALNHVTRNTGATKYVLPTNDEWHKAAYYDPTLNSGAGGYWTYPTKSNTAPSNILSSTGTNNANFYDYSKTGSDCYTDPVNFLTEVGAFAGSPGPYGTYDMGGDVFQWNEQSDSYFSPNYRIDRGGAFQSSVANLAAWTPVGYWFEPTETIGFLGFRVASLAVPEPGSIMLVVAGGLCLLAYAWRDGRPVVSSGSYQLSQEALQCF